MVNLILSLQLRDSETTVYIFCKPRLQKKILSLPVEAALQNYLEQQDLCDFVKCIFFWWTIHHPCHIYIHCVCLEMRRIIPVTGDNFLMASVLTGQ